MSQQQHEESKVDSPHAATHNEGVYSEIAFWNRQNIIQFLWV